MKLVIDRSKWLRGEGSDDSYLLRNEDGKLCCLGFYAQACGLETEAITNVATPAQVPKYANIWGDGACWLFDESNVSSTCNDLMMINDEKLPFFDSEKEREEQVAAIFAKHGVQVEFVG
jgi:hypothetical protein